MAAATHIRRVTVSLSADAAAAGTDFKSVEQGAATSVLLAASPLLDGIGGRYFENCNEAVLVDRRGGPGRGGVAPYALDPANAERLCELSLKLVG
jgi:hypothetical protein